ncbi:hypothetical protein GCM10011610_12230 [Nocardia rhizosphaerihabitans]|uniref:Uncharacterized protein n=1 Tax=Nocardia rhizosphaerihabitans TaxID=1691570 RepID=A0ABQ2K9P8_9NOCA|nr:hypothetical protein GCM10011610_12230 [Nocardia rhizosphaerihabitans]
MPNTVSTSSSSRDRTTDCAPVTRSGATWRRVGLVAGLPAAGWFAEGADLRADGPGRAVGALTVFVPYFVVLTPDWRGILPNTKKPPTSA